MVLGEDKAHGGKEAIRLHLQAEPAAGKPPYYMFKLKGYSANGTGRLMDASQLMMNTDDGQMSACGRNAVENV